jgi:aspartate aminotransferase
MTAVLAELKQLQFPSSDALGPSTFQCGDITGGEGYNIVASKCTAVCSVRVAKDLPRIEKLIE